MAAPAYKASGTFTAGIASITPPYPTAGNAPAADDIAILVVTSENQAISLTTANGFVEVGAQANKAAGTAATDPACRVAVYWKRCTGGDSAPVVADSGNNTTGQIHLFTGCETTGDPWDVFAEGADATSDTSGSIPGATTTVADTLVVLVAGSSRNVTTTAEFSAWTNADLTSLTERTDNTNTSGLGGGHGMATGVKAAAGAYGATAVTYGAATFKGLMSIALKPPGVTTHQGAAALSGESGYTAAGTVGTAYTREVEHFDGLADGTAITTTTGIFDSGGTTSSTVEADTGQTIRPGQPSMMGVATGGAGTWTRQVNLRGTTSDHTPQSYWRTYFRASDTSPSAASFTPIVSARNSAGSVCAQLGFVSGTSGVLKMRNTQTATGTGVALNPDTWYRIEWRLDWNAQAMRLRVWTGATLHSDDTADAILNELVTWDSVNGPPQHLRWGQGVAPDADTTFWYAALGWQTTDWLWAEPLADWSADGSLAATGTSSSGVTVHQGAATLTGEGVQTAAGTRTQYGAATASSDGTMTAAGSRATFAAAAVSSDGTLTAAGTRRQLAAAAVSGEGVLTAAGTREQLGAAAVSGDGSMTAAGTRRAAAAAQLAGDSSLAAAGTRGQLGASSLAGDSGGSAAGTRRAAAAAALSADGSLGGSGTRGAAGSAALDAAGVLTGAATRTGQGLAQLDGGSVLLATATGNVVVQGAATLAGDSSLAAAGARGQLGAAALSSDSSLAAAGTHSHQAAAQLGTTQGLSAGAADGTVTSWVKNDYLGDVVTLTAETTTPLVGAASVRATLTTKGGTGQIRCEPARTSSGYALPLSVHGLPVAVPGQRWYGQALVRNDTAATRTIVAYLECFNSGAGYLVSQPFQSATVAPGETRLLQGLTSADTPANTAMVRLLVIVDGCAQGESIVVDAAYLGLGAPAVLAAGGTRRAVGAVQLAGDSTLGAGATRGAAAAAALTGDGSMTAAAGGVQSGAATLTAASSMTAAGVRTQLGTLPSSANELGDQRIAAWEVGGASLVLTPGQPDPFGGNDATLIAAGVDVGGFYVRKLLPVTPGNTYTFSFWAKRSGSGVDARYSVWDWTQGANIVAATSYWTAINGSTWTRVSVTWTAPAGCRSAGVYLDRDATRPSEVLVYGPMVNAGAAAADYFTPPGMSARGNLYPTGLQTHQASVQLTAASSMTAAGTRRVPVTITLAGDSSTTSTATRTQPAAAQLDGLGELTAAGDRLDPWRTLDLEVQADARSAAAAGDGRGVSAQLSGVTADLDSDGRSLTVQGGTRGLGS